MTIIQFKPSAWAEDKTAIDKSNTSYAQVYIPEVEADSFEYLNMELEDEPTGLLSKLRNLFAKQETTAVPTQTISKKDAYSKAHFILKEALATKKELTKLIYEGVKNDYEDIYNCAGNLVTFSQDQLGRGVMTEYDQKDMPTRITTFALRDGSIYRIEEAIPNSRSYNKTIFFNYDNSHIEIRKGIKEGLKGETIKEIYAFEKEKPTIYKKDCKMTSSGAVAKEEYYF